MTINQNDNISGK